MLEVIATTAAAQPSAEPLVSRVLARADGSTTLVVGNALDRDVKPAFAVGRQVDGAARMVR